MEAFLPWTAINRREKFDAACFILGGEIRNRTNTHTHTHTQKLQTDATTAEKLRGPRFGSQQMGACALRPATSRLGWVREGVVPSRCGGQGYHPWKFFGKLIC